jgi:hypothetical protein
MNMRPRPSPLRALVPAALFAIASVSAAQSPPGAAVPATPVAAVPLSEFAWLAGCWRGSVNQREFREHWLPLRGNLLIGAGHTVTQERTQDFEYMRIEPRPDGLHYVAQPGGGKEASFRLADRQADGADVIYTFVNDANDFPQRIVYRRGSEGWLYVHVEGRVQGEDRRVIYPMRRIGCESGETIAK